MYKIRISQILPIINTFLNIFRQQFSWQKSTPFCRDPNLGTGRLETMPHSRKKLDLTGQRFGKLTVISPVENVNGRTAWKCRCDCGRETVVKTYHLRSGHTKSCGCLLGEDDAGSSLGQHGRTPEQMRRIRERLTYIDGTCVEMLAAKTVRRNNTSGVPGVVWMASKHQWRAEICFKGKRYYLGNHKNFEDAVEARKRAEHDLHDRFLQEVAQGSLNTDGDGK